jgi:hypothetical protein
MPDAHSEMSPRVALRYAWYFWAVFMTLPFLLFLYVIFNLNHYETAQRLALAQVWFIASMAYLLVVVPLASFWRSRLFKPYWSGETVAPRKYLLGMVILWLSFEVGGFISLIGCLVSHSLLPNLLPAMVAFGLFMPLWPSGRSMTHHVGNQDDPETYEEPR